VERERISWVRGEKGETEEEEGGRKGKAGVLASGRWISVSGCARPQPAGLAHSSLDFGSGACLLFGKGKCRACTS
jgi:hypothetical protein